jgi:hypothetical protein
MKERSGHFFREIVWAHALGPWRRKFSALRRLKGLGWDLLIPGPTPPASNRPDISPRGALVQRILRMGVLPVGSELHRINRDCSSICFCCSDSQVDTIQHLLLECPTFAHLREDLYRAADFCFMTVPFLMRAAKGEIDTKHQLAMLIDPGSPAWPSRSLLPAHADVSKLPSIAAAFHAQQRAVRLQWRREVCNFLVKLWGERLTISRTHTSAVCLQRSTAVQWCAMFGDSFMSSLFSRPEYGRS